MYIVSACLAGINCRYNGKNNLNEEVKRLVEDGKAVPVCPEQLGGLTTPRLPSEIDGGTGRDVLNGKAKVIRKDGADLTEQFIIGACETIKIADMVKAEGAIMKAGSPSCGWGSIYDGSFGGVRRSGNGVATEALFQKGYKIYTEEDMKKAFR